MEIGDRELMTSEELAVGMVELQLAGYVEYKAGAEDEFKFTNKGWLKAWELWFGLHSMERLMLYLLTDILHDMNEARRAGGGQDGKV